MSSSPPIWRLLQGPRFGFGGRALLVVVHHRCLFGGPWRLCHLSRAICLHDRVGSFAVGLPALELSGSPAPSVVSVRVFGTHGFPPKEFRSLSPLVVGRPASNALAGPVCHSLWCCRRLLRCVPDHPHRCVRADQFLWQCMDDPQLSHHQCLLLFHHECQCGARWPIAGLHHQVHRRPADLPLHPERVRHANLRHRRRKVRSDARPRQ